MLSACQVFRSRSYVVRQLCLSSKVPAPFLWQPRMDKAFRKRKLSAVKLRVEDSVTLEEIAPVEGLRRSKRAVKVTQATEIVAPGPKASRPRKRAAKAAVVTAVLPEPNDGGEQSAVLPAAPLLVWSDESLKAAVAHLRAADASACPALLAVHNQFKSGLALSVSHRLNKMSCQ